MVPEMRECIYGCVARRLMDYDRLVADVATTKWDINELQSQHSVYVDNLLKVCCAIRSYIFKLVGGTGLSACSVVRDLYI